MIPGILRLKVLLLTHGKPIAAALLLVGVLALGGASWVYTHPPVTEFSEQTDATTVRTEVGTSALVSGNTTLWETGDRLRDADLYPAAAPLLVVRAETTVPVDGSGNASQSISIVHRVVRDGTVVWQTEVPVANGTNDLGDGRATLVGRIDTRAVRERKAEIDQELVGVATSEVLLRVNTSYAVGDDSGVLSGQAPLRIATEGYWVDGSLTEERTHAETVRRTVTRAPDMTTVGGLAVIGGASSLAGGLVLLVGRWLPPAAAVRERLECERYQEWISVAAFEGEIPDRRVQMQSLGGLVNLGIDSKKRTFHDPDRGLYGVIDDDILYYYVEGGAEPLPPSGEDQWEWPFDAPEVEPSAAAERSGHVVGSDR